MIATGTAIPYCRVLPSPLDAVSLLHPRPRYYEPTTGRFTTLDPFGGFATDPLSLHKYLYVEANPTMGVDPSGYFFTYIGTLVSTSIQALLRSPKVVAAVKAADVASNIVDAVEIVGALAVGGPAALVNPAVLASLLTMVAPFGGVLKKASIVGNKLLNAADGLSDALKGLKRAGILGKEAAQQIGNLGALGTAQRLGFEPVTDFMSRYRGFDGLFKKGDVFVIVEAKGGASKLGQTAVGGQMSQAWINNHITILENKGLPYANELRSAFKSGRIQGLVVDTPIVDATKGIVGDPTFTLKTLDQIGPTVF